MEIDVHRLSQWYGKSRKFQPLPKFAEEKRDFAFVMDKEITCAQVENLIKESCAYVTSVKLFDVYEGIQLPVSKKSMAFNVVFTPQEEEFKEETIDGFVNDILQALKEKYEITLRA
jgi:phenylalanyl-tRNA synthetase beta chain